MLISDWSSDVCSSDLTSGVTNCADLRVRLAAFLALSDAPPSVEIGKVIFEAVQQPENTGDKWISHALLIAGAVHRQAFMGEYHQQIGHPDLSNTDRSEEHTSELQSLMRISYAVFCLKKKTK